jgi:hypothetical protein
MTVTIEHYECRMSHATMSRMPAPTITTATMPADHVFDCSELGEPTTDWSGDTERTRQFVKRDHATRTDHVFIIRITEATA